MSQTSENVGYLPRGRFDDLLSVLTAAGYECVGPTVRDGAIMYRPIDGAEDLPRGISDRQSPGHYRLEPSNGNRWFAWAVGPQAIKPYVFAPVEKLWSARRDADDRIAFVSTAPAVSAVALIGARACDLAALRLQDQHFLEGPYPDPYYAARRERLLVVAVNCSHPAETCFCASTGDGPHARAGFDLVLTELDDGFLLHVGSEAGARVAADLTLEPVDATQVRAEQRQARAASVQQSRSLPPGNLRRALFDNLEHSRWDDVAARCLACGNCTSVCPTCFCHAEREHVDPGLMTSEHVREWDSCFTQGHAYMHGYPVRPHIRQRYRQWLTHKLGTWHDQYGRSGCVGCGRCIAWCPVGIDITEEAAAVCAPAQSGEATEC